MNIDKNDNGNYSIVMEELSSFEEGVLENIVGWNDPEGEGFTISFSFANGLPILNRKTALRFIKSFIQDLDCRIVPESEDIFGRIVLDCWEANCQ